MFYVNEFLVKEASRVYGEFAGLDKQALDIGISPAGIVGAMAGGYAAKRHHDRHREEQDVRAERRALRQPQGLAEQAEPQMRQLIDQLKVVFTPINVVYVVNGTTVELIRVSEMTPQMQAAFIRKDGAFFRDVLLRKMDMEIQLAQQVMLQKMIGTQAMPKQANVFGLVGRLVDDGLEKRASGDAPTDLVTIFDRLFEEKLWEQIEKEATDAVVRVRADLESLRPFENAAFFFDAERLEKVAAPFVMETFSAADMEDRLDVGFLPDRVTFLVDGQMVEQLPLLGMDEAGIRAFRIRDRGFFRDFYLDTARAQEAHLIGLALNKQAADVTEVATKSADALLNIRPALAEPRFFEDADIHPLLYVRLFDVRYPDWRGLGLEALVAQLEDDFDTEVSPAAFDKIAMVKTLSNPEHSLFMAPFTYEKMVRALVGKAVDFGTWQGGLDLGEILFANDVASVLTDGENFIAFDDGLVEYTVNQVTDEGVRFILPLVFEDEDDHASEEAYYRLVNGLLTRVWTEADDSETFHAEAVLASTEILTERAEQLDPFDIEGSTAALLPGASERLVAACAEQVGAMFEAAEYLELRRRLYHEQRDAFARIWEVEL